MEPLGRPGGFVILITPRYPSMTCAEVVVATRPRAFTADALTLLYVIMKPCLLIPSTKEILNSFSSFMSHRSPPAPACRTMGPGGLGSWPNPGTGFSKVPPGSGFQSSPCCQGTSRGRSFSGTLISLLVALCTIISHICGVVAGSTDPDPDPVDVSNLT